MISSCLQLKVCPSTQQHAAHTHTRSTHAALTQHSRSTHAALTQHSRSTHAALTQHSRVTNTIILSAYTIQHQGYLDTNGNMLGTLQKAMVQQLEIKLDVVKDRLVGGGTLGNVVGMGLVCSGPASSIPSFKTLSLRYLDNSEPQDYESSIFFISLSLSLPLPYSIPSFSLLFPLTEHISGGNHLLGYTTVHGMHRRARDA